MGLVRIKNKDLLLSQKPSICCFLFLTCTQDFALAEPGCLRYLTFVFLQLEKLVSNIQLSACMKSYPSITQTIQTKHLTPITKLGTKYYP